MSFFGQAWVMDNGTIRIKIDDGNLYVDSEVEPRRFIAVQDFSNELRAALKEAKKRAKITTRTCSTCSQCVVVGSKCEMCGMVGL